MDLQKCYRGIMRKGIIGTATLKFGKTKQEIYTIVWYTYKSSEIYTIVSYTFKTNNQSSVLPIFKPNIKHSFRMKWPKSFKRNKREHRSIYKLRAHLEFYRSFTVEATIFCCYSKMKINRAGFRVVTRGFYWLQIHMKGYSKIS